MAQVQESSTARNDAAAAKKETSHDEQQRQEPFLTIHNVPVYFQEDWAAGIGGGLWSTGLAMAKYLQTDHAQHELIHRFASSSRKRKDNKMTIVELGSGNGLLSLCWLALAVSSGIGTRTEETRDCVMELFVTDTSDHLPLIQQTLQANQHILDQMSNARVKVLEHQWGEFGESNNGIDNMDDAEQEDSATGRQFGKLSDNKVDMIVGSDLAYRQELYDPLIASYVRLANEQAIILLGCTMADTTPEFFDRLHQAGFTYTRLADHLMDSTFRGQTFGIFLIQKKHA